MGSNHIEVLGVYIMDYYEVLWVFMASALINFQVQTLGKLKSNCIE
jgi:hypothetical protein